MNIGQFWMKFFSKETKVKGLAGTANYYVVSSWRFHIEKLMIQNNTKNIYIYREREREREREKERERKRNCYYLFRMENLQILFCNWIWSVCFAFFLLSLFLQIIFFVLHFKQERWSQLIEEGKEKRKKKTKNNLKINLKTYRT